MNLQACMPTDVKESVNLSARAVHGADMRCWEGRDDSRNLSRLQYICCGVALPFASLIADLQTRSPKTFPANLLSTQAAPKTENCR